MFRPAAHWIEKTAPSQWLSAHDWVIPVSQTVHIMALSVLFGSAMVINLRLLGATRGTRSVGEVVGTHVPWMWRALIVLLATGLVQLVAEPVRQFVTPCFWWKMALIPVAAGATALFAAGVRRAPGDPPSPFAARGYAICTTLLWITIIFLGRFIGYTWADHA